MMDSLVVVVVLRPLITCLYTSCTHCGYAVDTADTHPSSALWQRNLCSTQFPGTQRHRQQQILHNRICSYVYFAVIKWQILTIKKNKWSK